MLLYDLDISLEHRRPVFFLPCDARRRANNRSQRTKDDILVSELLYLFGQKGNAQARPNRLQDDSLDLNVLQNLRRKTSTADNFQSTSRGSLDSCFRTSR